MAKLTHPVKTTGSTLTATEFNQIVDSVNALHDDKVQVDGAKVLSDNNYTTTEKTKLSGIATGATVNSTDTQLRDRSTHTGTQAASTITGLSTVATTGVYDDLSGKPTIPTVPSNIITKASDSPVNITNLWNGTQTQYDAIATPDPATLYIISE